MSATPADWYADPQGRHQHRYWDGKRWTAHVANNGATATDPITEARPAPVVTPVSRVVRADSPTHEAEPEPPVQLAEEAPIDPDSPGATAARYVAACMAVSDTANATIERANYAVRAREFASDMSQHEISRQNFARHAEMEEAEFVPLYRAFVQARENALREAAQYLDSCTTANVNPELLLSSLLDPDTYGRTNVAAHILRGNFRASPAGFLNGLQHVNVAIQEDIFGFGEPGFIALVVGPPAPVAPTERDCPWCAETIKAAARICRFCNRDVEPVSHPA